MEKACMLVVRTHVAEAALGMLILATWPRPCTAAGGYEQTNLVSDQAGVAGFTDPRLVNPWGLAFDPTGLVFVSDNGKGLSTVYPPSGIPIPFSIHIPLPSGGMGTAAPSGVVFNPTQAFVITHSTHTRPARLLFATEDGTISGWNPAVAQTDAVLVADESSHGAVYKGIALSHSSAGELLLATDFHNRHIDIFDASFMHVHIPGAFVDPELPLEYSPFGIRDIHGEIVVTYAKLKHPDDHDDDAGPGHGFIDVFHPDGSFVRRLVSHGRLNSPWGLALAPQSFGSLGNALLVGNFGDGTINAYDLENGAFRGSLHDESGHVIAIDGLWGLSFPSNPHPETAPGLYFTAGPDGESHGLFGVIHAEH